MSNPYVTSTPKINRRITHKSRVLIYLRARQPNWISSVEIEHQAIDWGAKGATIDRRCRELENEGRIERKMIGKIVYYRLRQAEPSFNPNEFIKSLRKQESLL